MAEFIPAVYKRYLKTGDPGLRSKVPSRFLSPSQRIARGVAQRRKAEDASLYNPLAMLTPEQIRTSVSSLTNAELNPQLGALNRESAVDTAQGKALSERAGGYFNQLQAAMPGMQQAQRDASGTLASRIADAGTAANTSITNAYDHTAANQAQSDAIRGTGLDADTSQRLAKEYKDQIAMSAQQTVINQGQAAASNAGWEGIVNTAATVLPAQAADAQTQLATQLANQQFEIAGKRADVESTRGGIANKYLLGLRDSEFEKAATSQTLNLKSDAQNVAQQNADAHTQSVANSGNKPIQSGPFAGLRARDVNKMTSQQRDARVTRFNKVTHPKAASDDSKIYTSGPFAGMSHQQVQQLSSDGRQGKVDDYNHLTHPGTPKKGEKPTWLTPNEQNKATVIGHHFVQEIKQGKFVNQKDDSKSVDNSKMDRHELAAWLESNSGMDSAMISAVLDVTKNPGGHLSQYTIDKLHAAHYRAKDIAKSFGVKTARQFGRSGPGGTTPPHLKSPF